MDMRCHAVPGMQPMAMLAGGLGPGWRGSGRWDLHSGQARPGGTIVSLGHDSPLFCGSFLFSTVSSECLPRKLRGSSE